MMPRSPRRGRQRLSRSAEFERVYRQGKSVGNRHLVLYAFPNTAIERPRLGLSVSRKVGGAIERNRVKRLLRESFQRFEGEIRGGQDVVVVARPQALGLVEREGLEGICSSLQELLAKTGLLGANTAVEVESSGEEATAVEVGSSGEKADAHAA